MCLYACVYLVHDLSVWDWSELTEAILQSTPVVGVQATIYIPKFVLDVNNFEGEGRHMMNDEFNDRRFFSFLRKRKKIKLSFFF